MKVCLFNAIKSWGGGEKWHYDTAMGLVGRGVDVCAIVGRGGVLEEKFVGVGIHHSSHTIKNLSFLNPFKVFALYQYLKREKVDLIVFNSAPDVKIGVIASKLAGVKALVYRRGSPTPIKGSLINRLIVGKVTCILCNSEATKKAVIGIKPWIDPNKVLVIYNGVSVKQLTLDGDVVRSTVVIGAAGRLFHEKGHRYLIDALSHIDRSLDFELRLAGDGKLKSELMQQVNDLGLDSRVKFFGFVTDMNGFYADLDIFVMPSVWEGFGFAMVEAMLYGTPAVAFNTGSIPEILTEGDDGFIIEFGDVVALAQKIERLIRNESERKSMGMRAHKNMADRFSHEKAIEKIEALFRRLVEKK